MQAAPSTLPPLPLPDGITETQTPVTASGLSFHVLEAGYSPSREKPLVLLLHGFPEMAYSWRNIMPSLAAAGYYVVAADQRGYGRTTGWDTSAYQHLDLSQFTMTSLVRDMCVLVAALGYHTVRCVVGHDFGAVASSLCALMRPDVFTSVVMMSHPFKPPPSLPFDTAHEGETSSSRRSLVGRDIQRDLASLPQPRKHYKWYNSTASAAEDWNNPSQGMHEYLRGYFHLKSADWSANEPRKLKEWSAEELANMPEYYVMPLNATMPEVVASNMENEDSERTKRWLPDEQLDVYVNEWKRVGFQGGLNWYRCQTDPAKLKDLDLFAGRKIDVPSVFISGESDWGNHQQPGVLENFPKSCSDFRGVKMIKGAGHWPQQEQPEKVTEEILGFLSSLK
ncbi:alpha/beta-hydrolase [Saccharata proteae CBS 121410]|uniref:Alpha/beta-hydrolase n=1 Tax=Saccharata proteae CBS 121410 TaxID=1314787 RepID=A0A9P4HR18_9PEZI|nr:alpha/beta-hydrolase [Saccharata proteae CBS 121410]